MSGHTKGPWNIQYEGHAGQIIGAQIVALGGGAVAYVDREANARLISAAPDLLEAIKALLGPDVMTGEEPFDPVSKAFAAIAKAEGK